MKALSLVLLLLLLVPTAGQSGNMQLADRDALNKERLAWRAINMEELKLRRDLAKAQAEWTPLAGVESEHSNLVQQVEQAVTLVKALTERRYRMWKSATGAQVFARLAFQSETLVRLRNEKGEDLEILVADLSAPDQAQLTRIARALDPSSDTREAAPEDRIIGLDDTRTKTIRNQ